MSSQPDTQTLRAKYTGPESATEHFAFPIAALPADKDVSAKTEYLSYLRGQLGQLQTQVNAFLTEKMEEDKARQTQPDTNSKSSKNKVAIDEQREEDMYGEEAEDEQ